MKAEELIVGHFDAALTPAQEAELQRLLSGSPEARATYDRHANIHALLLQDAASLAPSGALDEAVIGAALSTPAEIAGAGAAGMGFGAKMAAIVSNFAVGGLSFVLMSTSTSEHTQHIPPATPAPAVSPMPKSTPVTLPSSPEAESTSTEARPVEASRPSAGADQRKEQATALRSTKKGSRAGVKSSDADQKPTLSLPKDATVITHPPKVDNSGDEK